MLDFFSHAPKARGRGGRKPRGTCRMGKRSSNGPPRDRIFGLPAALSGLRPHAGFHGAAAASLGSAPGAFPGLTLRPADPRAASSRHRLASPHAHRSRVSMQQVWRAWISLGKRIADVVNRGGVVSRHSSLQPASLNPRSRPSAASVAMWRFDVSSAREPGSFPAGAERWNPTATRKDPG